MRYKGGMEQGNILEHFLTTRFIATLVLAVILLTARYFVARYIRRAEHDWTAQQRLRWIGATRTWAFVILLLVVVYIWGETIQGFAVSIFAIAFAMVFSVKGLCECANGAFVRFRGHHFDIGDRIEMAGYRGDVIDTTLMTTTIQEVGSGAANHQFTGRRVTIPNKLFVKECVVNESFLENYYMNNIAVPIKPEEDWKRAKKVLLQIAQEECAPYLEQARQRIQKIERTRSLELPSVEPRVTVSIPSPDQLHLHLRIPSPVHLKGRLEQVVLTRFLEQFYHQAETNQ
ncbi:MAG: hypothetical protein SP4CHLAM1_16970 [Chlamydiia bacterium]|nr:hypothetical protein [Chlamydiia bacterium]MCH9630004.1 hypothetical protein [Chlamydiia bacterium]